MEDRVRRVDARAGYDRWSSIYDQRPTALVALDRRFTLEHLNPRPGERILDAGCGTGAHLSALCRSGVRPVGLDLSAGMLGRARARGESLQLVQCDLDQPLPLAPGVFDAVLCSLVSDHLRNPDTLFDSSFVALRRGGRLVFSAFHPAMASAGVEAHFELDGVEYRLGAELHGVEDFARGMRRAGFTGIGRIDYEVDESLVRAAPSAAKHFGRPLLLVMWAKRPF